MKLETGQKILYDGSKIQGRGLQRVGEAIIIKSVPDGITIEFTDDSSRIWLPSTVIQFRIKEL